MGIEPCCKGSLRICCYDVGEKRDYHNGVLTEKARESLTPRRPIWSPERQRNLCVGRAYDIRSRGGYHRKSGLGGCREMVQVGRCGGGRKNAVECANILGCGCIQETGRDFWQSQAQRTHSAGRIITDKGGGIYCKAEADLSKQRKVSSASVCSGESADGELEGGFGFGGSRGHRRRIRQTRVVLEGASGGKIDQRSAKGGKSNQGGAAGSGNWRGLRGAGTQLEWGGVAGRGKVVGGEMREFGDIEGGRLFFLSTALLCNCGSVSSGIPDAGLAGHSAAKSEPKQFATLLLKSPSGSHTQCVHRSSLHYLSLLLPPLHQAQTIHPNTTIGTPLSCKKRRLSNKGPTGTCFRSPIDGLSFTTNCHVSNQKN
ncbi:hypothetical protein VP01_650g2 [Puccinia sorghi]|uniref:Uncharacterized protein n=1 Tax=Puccinia sorghi TaxID=27349 RepID=A0A0L6UHN9_9BASI|nr:hypothetical protein VP01_650g2 [Puccinia sorghi]